MKKCSKLAFYNHICIVYIPTLKYFAELRNSQILSFVKFRLAFSFHHLADFKLLILHSIQVYHKNVI